MASECEYIHDHSGCSGSREPPLHTQLSQTFKRSMVESLEQKAKPLTPQCDTLITTQRVYHDTRWMELSADHPLTLLPYKYSGTAPKSRQPRFNAKIVMNGPTYPSLTTQSLKYFDIP